MSLTSMSGFCTNTLAKASVGIASFGGIQVLSITSQCNVGSNTPTFSAVYNGMPITTPTTIVVNGYTLNFGEAVTVGVTHGLTALHITTPTGGNVFLATTLCSGPYPLNVATDNASLGQQPTGFTGPASHGPAGHSFPSALVLAVAICAFIGVNFIGFRAFRRLQNTSAG